MNVAANVLQMDKWGIPHPDWEFVQSSSDLKRHDKIKDYCGWTIRVFWKTDQFQKPLYANWVSKKDVPGIIDELATKAKKDFVIVTYPSWIPKKSGTLLIEKRRIIIESCKGMITRLMRDGICDAGYQISPASRILSSWGDKSFLNIKERKQVIDSINKIPSKNIILEWAIGKQKEFIFYKMESVKNAGKALVEKYT